MSSIHSMIDAMGFFRPRTLLTLDRIAQEKDPMKVLGWRPGPGRAHIAWQLMHIGITEELFATEGSCLARSRHLPIWRHGSKEAARRTTRFRRPRSFAACSTNRGRIC